MNLQELNAYAIAGKVDELNLISMEGGIYLLEARMHGAAYPLADAHGQVFNPRSIEHAREVLRNFPQVGVGQWVHHLGHQAVVAAAVAEVEQLVVEVACGLAGDARVVAIGCGAALGAMAGGAGLHALGQCVFKCRGLGGLCAGGAPAQGGQQDQGPEKDGKTGHDRIVVAPWARHTARVRPSAGRGAVQM